MYNAHFYEPYNVPTEVTTMLCTNKCVKFREKSLIKTLTKVFKVAQFELTTTNYYENLTTKFGLIMLE